MIKPTIGRVVWYRPAGYELLPTGNGNTVAMPSSSNFHAATIAEVWSDSCVNLAIVDSNGVPYPQTSVPLYQGDAEDCPEGQCCWMPYQKQQAEKQSA